MMTRAAADRPRARRPFPIWRLALALCFASPVTAGAADTLAEAHIRIAIADALTCTVTASIDVSLDAVRVVEQRVQRVDGARIEDVDIAGAEIAAPRRTFGTTEVFSLLVKNPGLSRYEVRYRAVQPEDWPWRCPLWLPVLASDGRSRQVTLEVTLPAGAQPAGWAFPALRWEGQVGRTRLGNVPAFVRAPFAAPGETRTPGLNVGRTMDYAAVGALILGTAIWAVRRRR